VSHDERVLNLGLRYLELKEFKKAEAAFRQGLHARPDRLELLNNLGSALIGQGRAVEAQEVLRQALAKSPDHPVVLRNLADALRRAGDVAAAEAHYRKAVAVAPRAPVSHYQLGFFLEAERRYEEALAAFREALRLKPAYADAHNMAGVALLKLGRLEEALGQLRQALRGQPSSALFHANLGLCHRSRGEYEDALAAFDKAIELRADYADAHFGRALIHLLLGDFERGWREFEWRLQTADFSGIRKLPVPRWEGADLRGKTIFVYAEQGYGDTIQFFRYLRLLRGRNPAKIVFCCDEVLRDLFAGIPDYDAFTTRVQPPADASCHIPLMSLPGLFGTRTGTVPADVPYLRVAPALVERWRERLGRAPGRRIGIAWAGRPTHPNDYSRSCPVREFLPLFDAFPHFDFVSLQVGKASGLVQKVAETRSLVDFSPEIRNFTDTAAIIENLDLVITVDTVVAHLAGALGKPVWVLLNFDPDWRWLRKEETTAWYPTMRLFRQPRPGDWRAIMDAVRGRLSEGGWP